jgi:epoxyqueuosine reductase
MAETGTHQSPTEVDTEALTGEIKRWGVELGFQSIGITGVDLAADEARLLAWLEAGFHGEMEYMSRHGVKRSRPQDLIPGTLRVISGRMNYFPQARDAEQVLQESELAYVSRYALGRDYHKLIRRRLQKLATRIEERIGAFGYRVFVDSAPVLEKALARNAGLGWIGKHTNLIERQTGSWFFLGELFTDLPLPKDAPYQGDYCGSCSACIDICPTQAITGPGQLDARRCISYLTIELRGTIPVEFRSAIGNRVFGCDDCQLVCPWNRFAQLSCEADFSVRGGLDQAKLTALFAWTETDFLKYTEGSAIRRIGHECFIRNVAVALGNATTSAEITDALRARCDDPSALIREHVQWALEQHL